MYAVSPAVIDAVNVLLSRGFVAWAGLPATNACPGDGDVVFVSVVKYERRSEPMPPGPPDYNQYRYPTGWRDYTHAYVEVLRVLPSEAPTWTPTAA